MLVALVSGFGCVELNVKPPALVASVVVESVEGSVKPVGLLAEADDELGAGELDVAPPNEKDRGGFGIAF